MGRRRLAIVVGLILSLVAPWTVLAEGSWNSFLSGVRQGFESRRWYDNHNDPVATTIRFDNCRDDNPNNGTNDWANVTLYRDIPILPDDNRGNHTLNCYNTATGNWGEQLTAGDFHFTITGLSGQWIDASYVEVNY